MLDAPTLAALIARPGPRHRTASDFVESVLAEAILAGVAEPGTPLRQEDLAALFGVSRMPVREALRRLQEKALVDFAPHRGAVVAALSPADAVELAAVRAALEGAALAAAVPRLDAAALARAGDLIDAMDAARDPARLIALNRDFHLSLYAAAANARLDALIRRHLDDADRYLRFHLTALGVEHLSQEAHRAILAACAERDVERAIRLTDRHIRGAGDALAAFLKSRSGTKP